MPADLLRKGIEVTDCNAAVFDAANGFGGCIAGIQEVLKRQGLLASTRTLSNESLGRGQAAEIDRVCQAYPHLIDDEFVADQTRDVAPGVITYVNHRDTKDTETHRERIWQPSDEPRREGASDGCQVRSLCVSVFFVSLWLTYVPDNP